jgi:hypothetical protein
VQVWLADLLRRTTTRSHASTNHYLGTVRDGRRDYYGKAASIMG